MLLEKLKILECSLHGEKRSDRHWLEQILHPQFHEITRSGLMVNRIETIASLEHERDAPDIRSADFQLICLGDTCVILHYRTSQSDGSRASLRTSYWILCEENGWQLAFHQGTPEAGST
ncbi:DUF4440 domain-containing protein [Pantoea sp. GM01]|uniref:nuclear transport factor 2 family protein n=1 Tax=Pantoea sp. GM01 TaxID=1144320 RepID=UPI00027133E4|nr:DUF4440 domain-containing protein [Pantoea sp. GM01]EJL93752.1 hypothetical protein PMI17_00193 [Pantoea sp. GM01]